MSLYRSSCLYGVRNCRRFVCRWLGWRTPTPCRSWRGWGDIVLSHLSKTFTPERVLLGGDDVVEGMLLDAVLDGVQPEVPLFGWTGRHSEKWKLNDLNLDRQIPLAWEFVIKWIKFFFYSACSESKYKFGRIALCSLKIKEPRQNNL